MTSIPLERMVYTPAELAEILETDKDIIRMIAKSGRAPAVHIGQTTIRIPKSAIETYRHWVKVGESLPIRERYKPIPASAPSPELPMIPPVDVSLNDLAERMERLELKMDAILDALGSVQIMRRQVSPSLRERIYDRDGGRCRYCGKKTRRGTRTLDHIMPVVLGGTDDEDNLVTACVSCNAKKGRQPLILSGMNIIPLVEA